MKIFLLRHAKAESSFPDCSRVLASSGRSHAAQLGASLKGSDGFLPLELWCSPLVRAQETADVFLEAWGGEIRSRQNVEQLEPEMDPEPLVQRLAQVQNSILLVGHNPNLSILASLLLSGERRRTRVHLKTCNLICLEWDPIPSLGQFGPCELGWMLDPRVL